MTTSRPDPEESVTLSEAVERFALDQPTAARIRALLNGMALRWWDHQSIRYRLCDVIAAIAYVHEARTKTERRTQFGQGELCPFCGADTTRGWYADYCMTCGAEYEKALLSQGA
jgi:hypothetical protein